MIIECASPHGRRGLPRPLFQEAPKSNYQPGNSVSFAQNPTSNYIEDYEIDK